MKKLLFVVAICAVSTPALAQYATRGGTVTTQSQFATRGGVNNSASVEQAAGAFAFAQVGQGERVTIESPRNDPLIVIESGAFVMPYINESFNASRGGEVRVYEPVGSYVDDTRVFVDVTTTPIP